MSASHKAGRSASDATRRPLRVLLVEDSQPDAALLEQALDRGGFAVMCARVDTEKGMEQALRKQAWDLILCDHSMPQFDAPTALELVKKHHLDVPFIIVSGYIEEETAVAAMKAGANDSIVKDRLARLVPAVERELRDAEVRQARKRTEVELRRAQEELELRVEQRTAALRAANLKLENVIAERRRLENELLEIAEHERRRIGFDLHDDLGQKLTGVSMMLKGLEQRLAADRHPTAGEARKLQLLINDIILHTHDLAHNFSSLDIKGDDLSTVLKGLAGNVRKMFAIPCGLTIKRALPDLQAHTMLQLYKIAQEAISNAIKHGKATQVAIALARDDNRLVMTIKNDGLPFAQPATAKNRMGLRIMNYRANTIGATLDITPLDKSGTLVTCVLPINNGSKPMARVGPAPDRHFLESSAASAQPARGS